MEILAYSSRNKHKMKGKRLSLICPLHGYKQMEKCDECVLTKNRSPYVHTFKPMVYEDICEHPILIESKQHLKRECKKHNVTAARLL